MSPPDSSHPDRGAAAPKPTVLTEVKYSLPEMLAELEAERGSAMFAMEKLDQAEIGKLFKAKKPTRAKPKS
ncbi:MAG TPA: hypothetical protein VN775_03805 [Opitutaceae bacterium]|nr:hypothetical protein [Opitutaceae bacterium]